MLDSIITSDRATWAVIPAGGNGSRFSSHQDKLLVNLDGVPVLLRTIQSLLQAPSIQGIVLVSSQQNQDSYQRLIAKHLPDIAIHYATGGVTRRHSVYQGLLALPDAVKIVAVHDAARPLIQPETVERAISLIRQGAIGAVVALPIHDTVKKAYADQPLIESTVNRSLLWRAQTPQVFDKMRLLQAHQQTAIDTPITDDAQLLELARLGPIAIVPGDESNLKITTPTDVIMAEAFLRARQAALL